MFNSFFKPSTNNNALTAIANGAVIIDVRSPGEFLLGHVPKSINIPLQQIPNKINELRAHNCPLVFCCASGSRSGQATRFLEQMGFKDVYNAGSWQSI